jgi:hypothetical protein
MGWHCEHVIEVSANLLPPSKRQWDQFCVKSGDGFSSRLTDLASEEKN